MAEFFAAYPALQTLAQILSEVLRWLVILPVLGFVIVWFRSMRQDLPENTPIAVLVNAATRDVTRIVNPETAIGRSRQLGHHSEFPHHFPQPRGDQPSEKRLAHLRHQLENRRVCQRGAGEKKRAVKKRGRDFAGRSDLCLQRPDYGLERM